MSENWKLIKEKNVGILSFERHPKNYINFDVMTELREILGQIDNDLDIKVLIIDSNIPEVFISGADVGIFDQEFSNVSHFVEESRKVFRKMEALSKPIIAAIDGICLGGGCEFALSCDIRVASQKAQFGQPEILYSLIPGGGGVQRLSRLVGKGQALKMMLTGFTLSAKEAYRTGLVEELVEEGKALMKAKKIAQRIERLSPLAIKTLKELVYKGEAVDIEKAYLLDYDAFQKILKSYDMKEGINAFFERRVPEYRGY